MLQCWTITILGRVIMQLIFIVILGAVLGFLYGKLHRRFYIQFQRYVFLPGSRLSCHHFSILSLHMSNWCGNTKQCFLKGLRSIIFYCRYLQFHRFFDPWFRCNSRVVFDRSTLRWRYGDALDQEARADTSFGFLLLFINLLFISLSLLMLHMFATYSASYFGVTYDQNQYQ